MTEHLSMDQAFIRKLTDIVLSNLTNESFSAGKLAKEAGISYITLHRRLKAVSNKDVSEFIREIRLKRSMEMILNNEGTFAEISYKVGFNSPNYFNKCFHEYYGYPPGEVKKRELKGLVYQDNKQTTGSETNKTASSERSLVPFFKGRKHKKSLIISFAVLSAFLLFFFLNVLLKPDSVDFHKSPGQSPEKSIVVLPFKIIGEDPGNQAFTDGVTESILNNLGRIKEFKVISKSTVEQLRAGTMTSPEIAAKLKVNYLLTGSVQKQSDNIRIIVQLIDARNDQYLWSEKYDRVMQDIFAVQSDIALQVANTLKTTLSSEEIEQVRKIPTKNIEAYNNYLYGRYFLNKNLELTLYNKSIEYFKKSIKADSDFAPAYAGMARAYFRSAHYGLIPSSEGYSRARELALEALRIDKNLGEAHSIIGSLALYEFKWGEAREEYLKAIDCEPDNPDAHVEFGQLLFALGNIDEAEKEYNKANELDPLSLGILLTRAILNKDAGRIEEMAGDLRKIQEIDSAYSNLYRIYTNYYWLKGDTLNVIKCLKKVCETDSRFHKYGIDLMNVNNKSGYKAALEFWLKAEIENKNPVHIAAWCLLLNRKEEALTWLEKAYEERHSMISSIYNAWPYKTLRSEPRFQAIIKKMGLSEYQSRN